MSTISNFILTLANWAQALSGWRRALVALGLGAIGTLALAPVYFVPAIIVSFAGLVWLIDGTEKDDHSLRTALWIGWLHGFGFYFAGLYWIGFAFLVDAETFGWLIPVFAILMPGGLALFSSLGAGLARKFWSEDWTRGLVFALVWSVLEWMRGHILTGFPWNLPGYTWTGYLSVAQSASLIGIYGLSFLTILLAAFLAVWAPSYRGANSSRVGLYGTMASLLIFAGFAVWGFVRLSSPTIFEPEVALRLVQASVPQEEKWKPENQQKIITEYLALTLSPPTDPTIERMTHVIWPEAAVPVLLASREDVRVAIGRALGPNRYLLTGSTRYRYPDSNYPGAYYNSFHMIGSRGEILATYDKYHLVPFGEYLPLKSVLSAIGLKKLTQGTVDYTPGPGPQVITVPGAGQVLPMICYEAIFPGRVPLVNRPDWILNVTNDAWYRDTAGPRQHLSQAQMRAIEEGVPLVRSANTGISAIVDPYGRIVARLGLNKRGVLDGRLPQSLDATFYARIGDGIFWLFCLATFIVLIIGGIRRSLSS